MTAKERGLSCVRLPYIELAFPFFRSFKFVFGYLMSVAAFGVQLRLTVLFMRPIVVCKDPSLCANACCCGDSDASRIVLWL